MQKFHQRVSLDREKCSRKVKRRKKEKHLYIVSFSWIRNVLIFKSSYDGNLKSVLLGCAIKKNRENKSTQFVECKDVLFLIPSSFQLDRYLRRKRVRGRGRVRWSHNYRLNSLEIRSPIAISCDLTNVFHVVKCPLTIAWFLANSPFFLSKLCRKSWISVRCFSGDLYWRLLGEGDKSIFWVK